MAALSSHLKMRLGRLRQEITARVISALPRSSLHFIPGTSRSFGPPRRSATLGDYLKSHPGEWISVLPAETPAYPPPKSLPKDAAILQENFAALKWPESGVAIIPGGRVLDDNAWPVGRDDTFLHEFAFRGARPICAVYLIRKLSKPVRLAGTALNLGSCWAPINFGHFLLDALPRLELFRRAGLSLDAIDHIILPGFAGPSASKLISRLGLPSEKIIRPTRGTQYEFDQLVQPSYPGLSAFYRPIVAEFYRRPEFAPTAQPERFRRLYIPRRHARNVSNEPEIVALLAAHGFETVDFRAIVDEPTYFAEAEAVVGPHGAGLSSLLFCQPGTRFLEFVPSNHVRPYFYSAACAAGLDYWCLVGRAEAGLRSNEYAPPSDSNFHVDPADLATLLDRMGLDRLRAPAINPAFRAVG